MRAIALSVITVVLGVSLASAQSDAPGPLPPNASRSEAGISQSTASLVASVSVISDSVSDLAGADVGMNKDDSDLALANNSQDEAIEGIFVKETEKEMTIDLSSDILFDFNKWSIRADASRALMAVEKILSQHAKAGVTLEGHTDSVGSDQYNKDLSMKRALSVREWFIENSDVPARRFKPVGLGESRPVAANMNRDGSDNPDGRQKNRRVTIVVQK